MHIYVGGDMCRREYRQPWSLEEGFRPSEVGVTGGYKLHVGAWNKTQDFCKRSKYS